MPLCFDIIISCQPAPRCGWFFFEPIFILAQMEGDKPLKFHFKNLSKNIPLRLTLVILLSTVAMWAFSATETPVYSLFQSSVQTSAVATPTPPPPPTNTPVPPPAATDTPVTAPAATDTPQPPAAPTSAPEQPPQPQAVPTDTPAIQSGAVPEQPTATPTIVPSQTEPAVLQPIAPTEPTPAPETTVAPAVPDTGRVVNQVKLVDTIVEWLAYGWMCLGAMALILVAGFFAYLHNRGKKLNHEAE